MIGKLDITAELGQDVRVTRRHVADGGGKLMKFREYVGGKADDETVREIDADLQDPHSFLRRVLRFAVRRRIRSMVSADKDEPRPVGP